METPAYEGGIGGKFRKRPFRRASATPYDRPPSALRGVRGGHVAEEAAGSSGWLSKLVDPASRLIATGASRLFSSVFRKRLGPSPETPDENHQSRQDVPDVACTISSSTIPSSELRKGDRDRDNPTINSDNDGIAELEQLLKQKTFTRVEFDRLAELLHSRTVEPFKPEPEVNNEKKEKANVSAQENGIRSVKLHESLSVPAGSLTIPQDEVVSTAELAKAYMGSRPSKVSSSAVSLRNQVFREDTNFPSIPSASKPMDLSVAPRSLIRFSGIPEHPENGYQTPRPRGRSAIYRMSRSPYFKVKPTTNVKGGELTRDGYTGLSSSQWTPRSAMHPGGKQVLKRGSSVLDSDFGSFGPIRRIRQKSNLMSPPKDTRSSLSGSLLSSPSTPLFKDVTNGFTLIQKPLQLDEPKYGSTGLQAAENGGNGISNASAVPLSPQSSERAQKLLQQLDKLLPSPKEKSSELKPIARDESPSKLTLDMLHGRALRSTEDIDSLKFFNMQSTVKLDIASDSHLPRTRGSLSRNLDMVEENVPLKSAVLGVKLTSEANGVNNTVIPATDAEPGMRSANYVVSGIAALPAPKKPGFQISAPEDSLELDDDDYNTTDLSSPLITRKDGIESMIHKYKNVISETAISEKPLISSSESMLVSSSISFREADKKASIQPVVTEKDIGFTFPVAAAPCTHSQTPPTPTMPTPLLDKPAVQKEQTTAPVFSFGSKGANPFMFSSTTTGVNDTAGIKVGEGSGSEPKLSNSNATTTPVEGSYLDKGGEAQKSEDLFKSFGNAISSGISTSTTPAAFAFGASTASSSLSNGSVHSYSSSFSVSATPVTLSETPVSPIFPNSSATTSSSGRPSISSVAPISSTAPSFQFGSGTSTAAPVSVSPPLDKSISTGLEAKPVKASPFIISSSTTQVTSAVFASTGSGSSSAVTTSAPFSSTGSAPSALATSAISSSTGSSSSAPATSSLFSSMGGSSYSLAPSSAFPSTGSSLFGFSASTQSTSSSPSFANNSSQNSTATTFGATGGSIFGTKSTQSGSGTSQVFQSSTSQFGSFSSSPAFGLSNSSSSGFDMSPFGSATLGAKPFSSSSGFSYSAGAGSSSASTSSSFVPAATTGLFGSSSHPSTSSVFASTGSTSSSSTSPSTGFSFGLSTPGSGGSPFTFGSSSGSVFSFASAGPTAPSTSSSPAQSVFVIPNPAAGFSSGSPGNDQMNVEDNMTDDTNQAAAPLVPTFGQPAISPATPSFVFGSPAVQPGGPPLFQFGSHQNPSVPHNPSPFQTAGNLEFPPGGSFSLGSGGGDKSGRKIVKVRRDKLRKK